MSGDVCDTVDFVFLAESIPLLAALPHNLF